jgi:hypothetical protein
MKNVNNYLFNPAELDERNSLRFEAVRKDYYEKKDLLMTIKELRKKRQIHYDDLNRQLQSYFIEAAKKQYKKDHRVDDKVLKELKTEAIIDEYISRPQVFRPMVAEALADANKDCKSYLDNKEDLSYVAFFRKKIGFDYALVDECMLQETQSLRATDTSKYSPRSII